MRPDPVRPPLAFGGQQGNALSPLRRAHRACGGVAVQHLAAMRVEVGDCAQQQGFAGAGWAGQTDAFAGIDAEIDRSEPMAGQGVDVQPLQGNTPMKCVFCAVAMLAVVLGPRRLLRTGSKRLP
jgi:hypothetical protein